MAPQVGAHHLQRDGGGRGVLMGGVSGVHAAKVVVLGAGVSGMNAAAIALGMQAEVLVDISIDQGGCFEDSRPTTHAAPTYALTNVTLPYALEIANRGWRDALRSDLSLAQGLSTHDGALTCAPVAEAHNLPYTPIAAVLA